MPITELPVAGLPQLRNRDDDGDGGDGGEDGALFPGRGGKVMRQWQGLEQALCLLLLISLLLIPHVLGEVDFPPPVLGPWLEGRKRAPL